MYGIIVRLCYGINRLLHVTDSALWLHECCFLALLKFWSLWGQPKSKQALIYIPWHPYCMQIYPWTFNFEEMWLFYFMKSELWMKKTSNCPLRLTKNVFQHYALRSSMKYFPAATTLGNQTWKPETASLFLKLQRQHRRNLNAGLKEVSLALMMTHNCTIYSLRFVFQPLFLTSILIQRTGYKTEADNVNSQNARKLYTTALWQVH